MTLREGVGIEIVHAEYVDGYRIEMEFSDGLRVVVDFEPFLSESLNSDTRQFLDSASAFGGVDIYGITVILEPLQRILV